MSDQERSHMKEQIILFQQKIADKDAKYIKLDNELRSRKKEFDKLQRRIDEGKEAVVNVIGQNPFEGNNQRVNNHQQFQNNVIDFEELMNSSIDAITQRIQNKHSKSKDRSPSVPKLNFRNMKEFQEQDWLSYAHKLEESIKVLNQRICAIEEENNALT